MIACRSIDSTASADSASILVADDNALVRNTLAKRLGREGYRVEMAEDGAVAMQMLQVQPFDLVLLDIAMPRMDGYEVLGTLQKDERLQHIPVIMITALEDLHSTVRCIEMGAQDYLPKPVQPALLRARVHSCLERKWAHDREQALAEQLRIHSSELEQQVAQQVAEISESQMATIFAMSKLAESRDPETGEHLERMREYCRILATRLGREEYRDQIDAAFAQTIYAASPLHDIGKVGVPDSLLLKPGRLDAQEWAQMQQHTVIGAETLRAVHAQHPGNAFLQMGIEIAESHHERWDGSGYPYGLSGQDIPLAARILALGDVYDALTSSRCYKDAFSHERSRSIILDGSGSHFDPAIVQAFVDSEKDFVTVRAELQDPDEQN